MGQKVFVGLITLALAAGVVRYTACSDVPTGANTAGDAALGRSSPSESGPAAATDPLPKASDPKVAAAIEEILAAWDKIPSVYAAVESHLANAADNNGVTNGRGVYYLQKQDGVVRIAFRLNNVLRIVREDLTKYVTGEKLQWVIDGKNLYIFTNQPSFKQAVKKKLDYNAVLLIGGRELFRDLLTHNKLVMEPEEMLDGRAVRVIVATPNDGAATKTRHYFDKTTGIRLKMEETDAAGKTTLRITLIELDTESSFSDEVLTFTVPEDVPFVDETIAKP